jgi:hypothetical protein
MKYFIVHTKQSETGETFEKWISAAHYELSAEHLLKQIESQSENFDFFVVPFILTLCASLEANLNDWLIIDTFAKHGQEQYKPLAEGFTGVSLSRKLRVVVVVLTDNTFQLRENSPITQQLDKLISIRNKITHPSADYHVEKQSETKGKTHSDKLTNHPLHTITANDCRKYYDAVIDFGHSFFEQYDKGFVAENNLIQELKRIGNQVSDDSGESK